MFKDTSCKLVTKTLKDTDGMAFELICYINLDANEKNKLKEFRENYAKTSSLHSHFNDQFSFSQKKYYKKNQFIENPPKLDEIENNFLIDIKLTLKQFKNYLHFDKLENLEKVAEINLNEFIRKV
jgi:hypothetical protein